MSYTVFIFYFKYDVFGYRFGDVQIAPCRCWLGGRRPNGRSLPLISAFRNAFWNSYSRKTWRDSWPRRTRYGSTVSVGPNGTYLNTR